jgi:hypothetical protein
MRKTCIELSELDQAAVEFGAKKHDDRRYLKEDESDHQLGKPGIEAGVIAEVEVGRVESGREEP